MIAQGTVSSSSYRACYIDGILNPFGPDDSRGLCIVYVTRACNAPSRFHRNHPLASEWAKPLNYTQYKAIMSSINYFQLRGKRGRGHQITMNTNSLVTYNNALIFLERPIPTPKNQLTPLSVHSK